LLLQFPDQCGGERGKAGEMADKKREHRAKTNIHDVTEGEDYPGSRRGDRVRLADVAPYDTFSGL
jgi:hypothetical protein